MDGESNQGRLAGGVALITGAAGGIGRETALRLASEGAQIAALDLLDEVSETEEAVRQAGGKALGVVVDVTKRDEVKEAVATVEARLGEITVAVNNAAISPTASFLDTDDELWRQTLAVNLTGPFIVGQEIGRLMAARGHGRIVNVSSVAATRAHENLAAYAASKAGLEALTRQMAFELGPHGIGVNAVAPGPILTPLNYAVLGDDARAARLERMPAGRLGKPSDIASVVAFLASQDAEFLQGAVIPAEGGFFIAGVRAKPGRR